MDGKTFVFAESRCGLAVTLVGTAVLKAGARRAAFSEGDIGIPSAGIFVVRMRRGGKSFLAVVPQWR